MKNHPTRLHLLFLSLIGLLCLGTLATTRLHADRASATLGLLSGVVMATYGLALARYRQGRALSLGWITAGLMFTMAGVIALASS